jgi:hypothetical protein
MSRPEYRGFGRPSPARKRAEAIVDAWGRLDGWERLVVTDAAHRQVGAGWPPPMFTTYSAEAADWVTFAAEAEIEAYAVATFEAMRPERRLAFLKWARAGS